ncbi:FAS1 domain-containing protein [Fusarium flagelliforme]|uniref:FAS1 domain-containing protein n=1 Tax=Fusarium flagelliforme TaxID=2675880 RepID=UPI001E8D2025|nr:FAS1 domain-containing protein [Fusarium flagelliforme]KAH7182376.1 FAS1 domain-containing protein [Fusarium flagelliforme]
MRSLTFIGAAVTLAFASAAIAQTVPEELAGAIANYSSLSLFRSLLTAAPQALITSLDNRDSNITVLVPTNEAIESYLKESKINDVTELNQTELQIFFSYHILSASLTASDFEGDRGLSIPTLLQDALFNNRSAGPQIQSQFGKEASGQVIFALKQDGKDKRQQKDDMGGPNVMIRAGLAQDIKMTAVDGSWGAKDVNSFQVVDKVLSPPRSCSNTVHTIKDPRLDALDAALIKAQLWKALDHSKNVTCLAPSTEAFKNAGNPDIKLSKQDLGGAILYVNNPTATHMLTWLNRAHTLDEVTYSNYLRDGQVIGTLNNTKVRVSIQGEDIFFNNAKVIEANVLTNNGLIHILDSVIEDGGKPSSTGTSTATTGTATATSNEGEATSTSSGTSEQDNSASQSHVGYWAFSSVVMAFVLL